jgi:hypothetical protein
MGNEGSKASVAITVDIGAMPFGTAGARIRFANSGCSIPSLEVDNASVLDEFYWLDEGDRPASESIRPLYGHPNQ